MTGRQAKDTRDNCVRLKIKRYNPHIDSNPHYETYSVALGEEKMNLLQALETKIIVKRQLAPGKNKD